jgi:Putative peptidoglycan binding domain
MRKHTFAARERASHGTTTPTRVLKHSHRSAALQADDKARRPVIGGFAFLQRTVGNAAIARALGERPNMTFESDVFKGDVTLEEVLNNKNNSRLKVGDKGGSVQTVQEALIRDDISVGESGADGKYGNKTSEAVKQFKIKHGLGSETFGDVGPGTMKKLDELNKGGNGPGPNPNPNPNPEPELDPQLEIKLDEIQEQYIRQFQAQDKALATLERDLRIEEEAPKPLLQEVGLALLKGAAKVGFELLLGGIGPLSLAKLAEASFLGAEHKDENIKIDFLKFAIEEPFKAIEHEAETGIDEALKGEHPKDTTALEAFIDAQRSSLIASQAKFFSKWIGFEGKLREAKPKDDDITVKDPEVLRFAAAQEAFLAVRESAKAAPDNQYLTALRGWSRLQAQHDLKKKGKNAQLNDLSEATDLSGMSTIGITGVLGVLDISINDIDPKKSQEPIKILEMRISGLSAKVRKRLNQQHFNRTIGELGLPRRVRDGLGLDAIDVMVSRNEIGVSQFIQAPPNTFGGNDGLEWLKAKGGGDRDKGVEVVMNEIDQKRISEVVNAPEKNLEFIQGPS